MSGLATIAGVLAFVGLILMLLALPRLRRLRLVTGLIGGLSGVALLMLGGLAGALALNLHTYQRLTYEQEIATLRFRKTAPRQYLVDVQHVGTDLGQRYTLRGDQWQVDARVVKWRGLANLIGLDSRYRLERLSGRYDDLELERNAPRSVFPLTDQGRLEVWNLIDDHARWLPWLDTIHGSASYLPMIDGGEFSLSLTQTGLIARPNNAVARRAVEAWR